MQLQQGKALTQAHLQMIRQQQQLQQAASPQIKAVGKSQVRHRQLSLTKAKLQWDLPNLEKNHFCLGKHSQLATV